MSANKMPRESYDWKGAHSQSEWEFTIPLSTSFYLQFSLSKVNRISFNYSLAKQTYLKNLPSYSPSKLNPKNFAFLAFSIFSLIAA